MNDEFYIGYEPALPPDIGRAVRIAVGIAVLAAFLAAGAFVAVQRPLAASRFDFGHVVTAEGYLLRTPAPALLVRAANGWTRYWLVSTGKFGAERVLGEQPEGWVRLMATLIQREPWRMLEVAPGSVAPAGSSDEPPPPAARLSTTPVTLAGEIVDSKCFLGVMNPGERTVHRDCAVRCLSGGVPAMFSYRDAVGIAHLAVLLTSDGQPAGRRLLSRAGRSVVLSGRLVTDGALEVLTVD
jgi:hypothetical protein